MSALGWQAFKAWHLCLFFCIQKSFTALHITQPCHSRHAGIWDKPYLKLLGHQLEAVSNSGILLRIDALHFSFHLHPLTPSNANWEI